MGFADAVRTCFRKYVTFSGRASRPEYWWFALFVFLGNVVFSVIDAALFGTAATETGPGMAAAEIETNGPLVALFSLATFVPSISAAWRRMHDTGRSGLFALYPLIVMVGIGMFAGFLGAFDQAASGGLAALFTGLGGIVLLAALLVLMISPLLVLWWLTRPSQPGPNEYGPNPREVTQ